MKFYCAIVKSSMLDVGDKVNLVIEIAFPDLDGCMTYVQQQAVCVIDAELIYDDLLVSSYNQAIDCLAAWLSAAEPEYIKDPSGYWNIVERMVLMNIMNLSLSQNLLRQYPPFVMMVPVDLSLVQSYKSSNSDILSENVKLK